MNPASPSACRPLRFAIIVPTTHRPVIVTGLKPRRQLPASHVVAEGDFRALAITPDYDRLVGASGPIAERFPGVAQTAWELRLSEAFETGRSWELPVSLAHGLLALGHEIVPSIAESDIVLWSTGAIDLDGKIVLQNYFLAEKLACSQEGLLLARRSARVVVLLPKGPSADAAPDPAIGALEAAGVEVHSTSSLAEGLQTLLPAPKSAGSPATPPSTSKATPWLRLGAMLAAMTMILVGTIYVMHRPDGATPSSVATVDPRMVHGTKTGTGQTSNPQAQAPGVHPASTGTAASPAASKGSGTPSPRSTRREEHQVAVIVEEHRAQPGRTCIKHLFSREPMVVTELRPIQGRFPPSRIAGLCRLVIRSTDSVQVRAVEVGAELLRATMAPDGPGPDARAPSVIDRVIRGNTRPLTYSIHARASKREQEDWVLTHALVD